METFSTLLAFCEGIHGSPVIPIPKASDAELWCFLWSAPEENGREKNQDAGDLRRHRTFDDVTVMIPLLFN